MPAHYDTIILGAGTMGAAAALALSRRGKGVGVLALDQSDIPNTTSAHHGHSRIFRYLRYQQPEYIKLIRRSEQLWDELNAAANEPILSRPGLLCLGKARSQPMLDTAQWAADHNIKTETLTRADLAARYPLFNVPPDYTGILEPNAGYLRPQLAIATMTAEAQRRAGRGGVTLHPNERTLSWHSSLSTGGSGVPPGFPPITVTTDRATYTAHHLIITAGAWSSRLLSDLGGGFPTRLSVTREVLLWTQPPNPEPFRDLPCWFIDDPTAACRDGLIYGFPYMPFESAPGGAGVGGAPAAGGRAGFKFALHGRGTPTNPDTINRTVSPAEQSELLEPIRRFIPAAVGPIIETAVCTYTNSPDLHPIIDCHPDHPNIAFACGFSGHGFKYALAIGELLADLSMNPAAPHPLPFFALSRLTASD